MMLQKLPPEWAPQSAIQLTWPRADGDFATWFPDVRENFVRLAVAITQFQPVWIATAENPDALLAELLAAGAHQGRVRIHTVESNDVWARDHGPITVLRDGAPVHLDFIFNGWGGKFDATLDNTVTAQLATQGLWPGAVEAQDFVLEGGGIEVDSQGTLLTTERCLLAPTRNPARSRADIESYLKQALGVNRVLWLRHGDLLGDDTDGHIDTVARFCDDRTIAYQACEDSSDPHYADLTAMADELKAFRQPDGTPYRLIALPLPEAIHDEDGRRLPAGYANFLILNGAVLVPTYQQPALDAKALRRLAPAFAGRQVIGVDCRALINQYGSLHCVTMQIPATPSTGA